jgi:hypothetical protein
VSNQVWLAATILVLVVALGSQAMSSLSGKAFVRLSRRTVTFMRRTLSQPIRDQSQSYAFSRVRRSEIRLGGRRLFAEHNQPHREPTCQRD